MFGDYGYMEEGHRGKIYDLKLLKRLYRYAIPFRRIIFIILFVTASVTLLNLSLPYITKIAVDRYIIAAFYRLDIRGMNAEGQEEFRRHYPHLANQLGRSPFSFIRAGLLMEMAKKDRVKLEDAGVISTERYLRVPMDTRLVPLIQSKLDKFTESESAFYIRAKDLYGLPQSEIWAIRARDLRGVTILGLAFMSILACMFAFNYAEYYYLEWASQKLMQSIRLDLFDHLMKQGMRFFDQYPVGRLVTRVTNDVQNLDEMVKSIMSAVFRDLFIVVGIIFVLLNLNLRLSLVCFILIPVMFALAFLFSHLARGAFRELRSRLAAINGFLQESFTGIKIIQAFCRENIRMGRFRVINHDTYLAGMKQIRLFALFMPAIDACSSIAVALLIWYGGINILSQQMTIGSLAAFIGYLSMCFRPIRDLAERYNTMQSAMASCERIFGFLDLHEEPPAAGMPSLPEKQDGSIEFRNVTFGYKSGEPVLNNITFTVMPGQSVALVGRTGAGKTSIVSLLERFYEPWSGSILVDGKDIRTWDIGRLRSRLGLVMQDVFLFSGDIVENVSLGREHISQDTIERICRYVNAEQFIEALPMGYRQPVREGGSVLSAGQRQLLACARALILDPPILVFDEATSSVDPENERLIQDAVGRLMRQRTTLVIAHRLSTIRSASKILVMHRGEIKEEGTHEELMARNGIYYRLNHLREA